MQYFGFSDPGDAGSGNQPNAARFNNNATNIDIQGVFPNNINFYTEANGSYLFPGQTVTTDASNYGVVFEGYFYGPPGDYSVTLSDSGTDDYGFVWANSSAYSGWTNSDAAIVESIAHGTTSVYSFTLAQGQFLPMTVLWVNVYQAGSLEFVITPPAGGQVTDTTGYFVQPYPGDSFVYRT